MKRRRASGPPKGFSSANCQVDWEFRRCMAGLLWQYHFGWEVSGLGLDGLQEVVFNGRPRRGAVRGGGKAAEVPNFGEWQCTFCGAAHSWNTRLSCSRCGTPGIGNLALLGRGRCWWWSGRRE